MNNLPKENNRHDDVATKVLLTMIVVLLVAEIIANTFWWGW